MGSLKLNETMSKELEYCDRNLLRITSTKMSRRTILDERSGNFCVINFSASPGSKSEETNLNVRSYDVHTRHEQLLRIYEICLGDSRGSEKAAKSFEKR